MGNGSSTLRPSAACVGPSAGRRGPFSSPAAVHLTLKTGGVSGCGTPIIQRALCSCQDPLLRLAERGASALSLAARRPSRPHLSPCSALVPWQKGADTAPDEEQRGDSFELVKCGQQVCRHPPPVAWSLDRFPHQTPSLQPCSDDAGRSYVNGPAYHGAHYRALRGARALADTASTPQPPARALNRDCRMPPHTRDNCPALSTAPGTAVAALSDVSLDPNEDPVAHLADGVASLSVSRGPTPEAYSGNRPQKLMSSSRSQGSRGVARLDRAHRRQGK